MTGSSRIPAVFLLMLALAAASPAQDDRTRSVFDVDGRQVIVLYDHFETFRQEENTFRPYGHVEAKWDQYNLKADFLEIDLKNRRLFAEGRVSFADRESVLYGERLSFNFEKQTGEIHDSYGLASPFVKYEARRIEQTDGQTLAFEDLAMTTCSQALPRWQFSCRKGKIKKEKYIEMRGALLRIKKVPVFYLPYLRYPISKEVKQSGFLFPSFGQLKLQSPRELTAAEAELYNFNLLHVAPSFFWNIRPNLDLTFTLDHYRNFGSGFGQELRYLFRHAEGNLRFLYFRYALGSPGNPIQILEGIDQLAGDEKEKQLDILRRGDYYLEGTNGLQIPALKSRLDYNLKLVSRKNFLRYLDATFERGRTNSIDSSASWTTSIGNVSINANASRRELFNPDPRLEASDILVKLPEVSFLLNRQKLGKFPGSLSLALSYIRSKRDGEDVLGDADFSRGVWTQRLRFVPSYELPLLGLPWLNAAVSFSSKHNFYRYDAAAQEAEAERVVVGYQELQATLEGPSFFRIFGGGGRRFKHEIAPKVEFTYATKVKNADSIRPVDYGDFPSWSEVRYSISSRLYVREAKKKGSAREVASFELGQSYFLDPQAAHYNRQINGQYPPLSDLAGSLSLRPLADFSLSASATYNFYLKERFGKNFTRVYVAVAYDREDVWLGGDLSLFSYRNPYMPAAFSLNWSGVSGGLRFGTPRSALKLRVTGDYDFTAKMLRYLNGQVSFDYQCLVFRVNAQGYLSNNKLAFIVTFGFSFGNLGSGGTFFGGAQ